MDVFVWSCCGLTCFSSVTSSPLRLTFFTFRKRTQQMLSCKRHSKTQRERKREREREREREGEEEGEGERNRERKKNKLTKSVKN